MNALMEKSLTRFSVVFLLALSALYSCKKEGQVGLDVQPKTDLISAYFKDTTTILSDVQRDDSVKTNAAALLLLGSYVDPIFGKTTCSFFSQLNIYNNANNIDFTGGVGAQIELVLDSAVLTLQYVATSSDARKCYGVQSDPQTFNVYKLTQQMNVDSPYYSARRIPFDSTNFSNASLIGTKTFTPQPDSNVVLKGVAYPPHIRIRIDSTFADSILKQSGKAPLVDNTAFHNFFPGIYVVPVNPAQASGQGAVFYFNPYGPNTKLVLYYRRHVSAPAPGDTLSYPFEINGFSAHFNRFQHDYTGTPVEARINNGVNDTDNIYVQSAQGIRTKITIPYLKNWISKGPIAVNKAEVLLKVDASSITTNYNVHPQLFLVAIDSVTPGKYEFPIDFYEVASAYGGAYNATTQTYSFNIARHVQQILDGKRTDHGFYLMAGGGAVNAERTVLFGSSKVASKLRFRLTYTKLY